MDVLQYLFGALTPFNLLLALIGVVAGTVIGALPGLSATMAVAVLVPITFSMEPASGLIMLGAIYTGAIYGGAFAAILVNTPGTPSAIATTFDGFPMAKRGDGDLAITTATIASVTGGLVGAIALLLLAPPLAKVSLAFGPVEYFWLAVLGLTLISALSEGDLLKGLVGACFGLLLSMMGVAVVGGDVRFTAGLPQLLGGVEVVSALIGLYCIPVLLDMVGTREAHLKVSAEPRGFRLAESLALGWRHKWLLIRSSVIGTFVGILPGAGGSIAGLVAYSEARRTSERRRHFGTGEPEGVMATESANNATVGGGFIPTLVLGIPGTPPDAVILGALLVQGIRTGSSLFTEQAAISYTFIFGLLIATILMLPTGLLIGRYAYKSIVTLPKAMLVPTIAFMTVIGSYAIQNSLIDVVIMLVLGVVGWILNRFGYRPSPIVLGLVLGQIAEQGFVQGWLIGNARNDLLGMYFGRPISLAIIAFILLSLFYPLIASRLRLGGKKPAAPSGGAKREEVGNVD
jgi:putative tricarboxylic transport membrane protein